MSACDPGSGPVVQMPGSGDSTSCEGFHTHTKGQIRECWLRLADRGLRGQRTARENAPASYFSNETGPGAQPSVNSSRISCNSAPRRYFFGNVCRRLTPYKLIHYPSL